MDITVIPKEFQLPTHSEMTGDVKDGIQIFLCNNTTIE